MYNGIVNVYKEKGFTSHDVVAKLRGMTKQKKIGHTGTLDPDAEGVLPVCFGNATKLCDMLTDKSKEYKAVLLLGKSTTTQDISGEVISESIDWEKLDRGQVVEIIESFIGEYDQIPPMYSALKVNGQKLYELARKGQTVERKARRVQIENIEIVDITLPRVTMIVSCSKGTYIRTLCNDIGDRLGCFGCMESLLRTRVGSFKEKDALKLQDIQEKIDNNLFDEVVIPAEDMFDYKKVFVKESSSKILYNGNIISLDDIEIAMGTGDEAKESSGTGDELKIKNNEFVKVYDYQQVFAGVYQKQGSRFKPYKMFLTK